jgi:hypothetical protein
MGHPPPSPLPKGAVDPPAAELRGVHIVRLNGLFEQSKPQMMPQVQGVTNSTVPVMGAPAAPSGAAHAPDAKPGCSNCECCSPSAPW